MAEHSQFPEAGQPEPGPPSGTPHPQWAVPVTPASFSPAPTNGFAVASMVLGIVGITIGWAIVFLGAIITAAVAVVFGHVALSDIKRTKHRGRGMAITGVVLGYITLGIAGLILLLVALIGNA